jgi:uncharacterized RDD family membrane protein YckC
MVVVLAWAGFAAAVGFALLALEVELSTPTARDALAFVTLILPVWLTFSLQEASVAQASFGKARIGLVVVRREGGRLSRARSMVRSGVKLLPWQLGHSSVFHLVADSGATVWMVMAVLAQALVILSVLLAVFSREQRSLHDLVAGTRVGVAPAPGA